MPEENSQFTGSERAAILLMTLGEKDAAQILKHMAPKEVQKLGQAMAVMTNVTKEQVNTVLRDFIVTVDEQTSLGIGSEDYIRKVMIEALGEDRASGLIDRILLGKNTKGLEALKWMDPRAVAELVRLEHPQIISIVLAYLDSDQAAAVLALMPERMRPDLLMRIATLDGIQPSALRELDGIMEKQFSGNTHNVKSASVGGVKSAANIMNYIENTEEAAIMEKIKDADADIGQKIEELMFIFDDLAEVDDRGMQALLREVSSETLILAMKGSDQNLKEKIFKNMSKRAAEMLRDDLEAKGPARLSEVEAAQKEILTVARRLSESGEISLGGKGEDFV